MNPEERAAIRAEAEHDVAGWPPLAPEFLKRIAERLAAEINAMVRRED